MGSDEDRPTNLQSRGYEPRDGQRSDLSIVPARGLRFERAGVVTRAKGSELSLLGRRGGKIERCSVDQHPMHDHGELAGKRHLCLLHSSALGEPHGPALEGRALDRLGEDDVSGLEQRRAHALVPILRDPAVSPD